LKCSREADVVEITDWWVPQVGRLMKGRGVKGSQVGDSNAAPPSWGIWKCPIWSPGPVDLNNFHVGFHKGSAPGLWFKCGCRGSLPKVWFRISWVLCNSFPEKDTRRPVVPLSSYNDLVLSGGQTRECKQQG